MSSSWMGRCEVASCGSWFFFGTGTVTAPHQLLVTEPESRRLWPSRVELRAKVSFKCCQSSVETNLENNRQRYK
eukprot:5089330-Amphidinium_carterae.1